MTHSAAEMAKTMAIVRGSVSATYSIETRNADGSLTVEEATYNKADDSTVTRTYTLEG